jgi:hypothetical protein
MTEVHVVNCDTRKHRLSFYLPYIPTVGYKIKTRDGVWEVKWVEDNTVGVWGL